MSVDRLERVNALIRREIAEALSRMITDSRFDRSTVTVTQVRTSRNLRSAKVMISVRDADPGETLGLIRQCRHELQQCINRHMNLKYTPVLQFEYDPSLQKGDRVLDLLSRLEEPSDPVATGSNPVERGERT